MLQCIIAAILLVAWVAAPATAAGLHCRNEAAETSCAAGKCETRTTGFTPMELSLYDDAISICAYSGCSSGIVSVRRQRGNLFLVMADVYPNAMAMAERRENRQHLSAIFNRKTGAVTMYWLNFVNAMSCAARH